MTAAWPLIGHHGQEQLFLEAAAHDKLHHAWMIEGPSGIGKSRFAERAGAFLLGARGPDDAKMDAPADDPVMRSLLAGSHPDFKVLRRELNDKGKLAQDISVEQVRDVSGFFSLKPALGGWRIAIIDAVDDLNRNGANALLKTLEEPPDRAMLFLVNHGSRPVLPTIRSRCRTLRFKQLTAGDMERALNAAGAACDPAALGHGRPGLAIRLATPAAMAAQRAARDLIKSFPKPTDAAAAAALRHASADETAMEAFQIEALGWLETRAASNPSVSAAWLETARTIGQAEALNMDSVQTAARLIALLTAVGAPR